MTELRANPVVPGMESGKWFANVRRPQRMIAAHAG